MSTGVSLETIDMGSWRESLAVRVADEQLPFVADHQPVALVILAKCHLRPGGRHWEPVLFRDGTGAAVGVAALAHRLGECELLHLAIDVDRQGEGLGTAAVAAVLGHVRDRTDRTSLVLRVHPENAVARHVYRSAGFAETDEVRDGEVIWRLAVERPSRP